jgi:hypothetical protein
MVKDPGKVIKLEGGTSTRKEGTSPGGKKIQATRDHKTPKLPPKKEK